MNELTVHQKLEYIVIAGKPKAIRHEGKTYYITKKKIRECEKEGGILPLLTLIPLIAGGVSAAGGVAGAAAGIAKAVNDKKVADEELAEQRRHNLEMEKKTGGNLKEHIENFIQALQIANEAKEEIYKFLENISDVIEVKPDKEGNGLYLNPPYRR